MSEQAKRPPESESDVRVSLADQPTVSLVEGDRLCVWCGFNLAGQRIVREPRYGLLVSQCPECGGVAALQEYPVLGKWAQRWGAILAGLWFLLISGGVIATGATIFGVTLGATQEGAEEYGDFIAERYEEDAASGVGGAAGRSVQSWNSIEASWWDEQDRWALLREAGGYRKVVAREAAPLWIALAVVCFLAGGLGGVVMMHARGARLATVVVAPLGVAAAFGAIAFGQILSRTGGTLSAWDAAVEQTWWISVAVSAVVATIAMEIGLFSGRPLARLAAKVFLPPRLRSSLAALWIADGLDPPRPNPGRSGA